MIKTKMDTELVADCHGETEVNLVTEIAFYCVFGSQESILGLEQKLEMVTAISVEAFLGVLQTEHKYIGRWREESKWR